MTGSIAEATSCTGRRVPWRPTSSRSANGVPSAFLDQLDAAIRANDQSQACAVVSRLGDLDQSPRAVFDRLLNHAVTEDGALHAEKYYRTVAEEFAATRKTFRWRQIVALARVTASEYGRPAPGVAEARERLGIG